MATANKWRQVNLLRPRIFGASHRSSSTSSYSTISRSPSNAILARLWLPGSRRLRRECAIDSASPHRSPGCRIQGLTLFLPYLQAIAGVAFPREDSAF
jgi:hypothetical protein